MFGQDIAHSDLQHKTVTRHWAGLHRRLSMRIPGMTKLPILGRFDIRESCLDLGDSQAEGI
jgi:hypothetical protein